MSHHHYVLLGLLCTGFSGSLLAQDCHLALRGQLTEAGTKEGLAYASVSIPAVGKGAVADEHGNYVITGLCENTPYTIELSHVECAHQTQVVRLTENSTMDFQLLHNADLKEVVVTEKAVALRGTQAENVVEKIDLEAAKGINLGETIKKLPGVTTLNTGATIAKPVIQGLHSNRIAIVNNNVTLEGQQWGSEHAPEIDPFTAGKISVVKGAAGVRYGTGAMGGAIVLEPPPLREKAGFGGWITLGGSSNGYGGISSGAVDWHLPGKSLTFRLQGTVKRSGNLRTPGYWMGNTGLSEMDLSAMAGWKSGRWTHEVTGSRFNQRLAIFRSSHIGSVSELRKAIDSEVPIGNRDEFTYAIRRPYQRIEHTMAKYRTTLRVSDKWKLSGQYAFQYNFRREYDAHAPLSDPRDLLKKPQLSFRIWTNSVDLALEHFPIRHWQGGVGVQGVQQLNYVGKGGFIPDYLTLGGGLWAMEHWRRYPSPWEFEFGTRYDYRWSRVSSEKLRETIVQFGNVSGTAGVIYNFSKDLSVKLNSGYAWRPPNVNELFAKGIHHGAGTYEQGRADLVSEKAWNTNLTLDWQGRRANAVLTLYRNQIHDFIYLDQPRDSIVVTVRGPFPAYFYQQANAVLQGLDASFSVDVLKNIALEGRASLLYGYRLAHAQDDPTTYHDWLPLMPSDRYQYGLKWKSNDQKPMANGASRETFVRLLASTSLRQTRIPRQGLTKAAPPTFTTLSLDAGHTFSWKDRPLEVGVSVQNLTNVRYREYLDFFRYYTDEPGVNVALRAKLTF